MASSRATDPAITVKVPSGVCQRSRSSSTGAMNRRLCTSRPSSSYTCTVSANGDPAASPARAGRRQATTGDTYWKKKAVMATTRVVDSTTGQNARSPGTRADDGPDQAARSAELTSSDAPRR